MSSPKLIKTDAEELLSALRQSVSTAGYRDASAPVHVVEASPDSEPGFDPSIDPLRQIRMAQAELDGRCASLGSLPPSPLTLRGRIGLVLVKLVDRLTWWQTAESKRFARAVRDYSRVHTSIAIDLSERVEGLEQRLEGRRPRVPARLPAGLAVDNTSVLDLDSSEDPLADLAGVPAGTVATISALEVVERLPFGAVIVFIDDALRALKPGGLLIVGAPILTELLWFVLENRGFVKLQRLDSTIVGERP